MRQETKQEYEFNIQDLLPIGMTIVVLGIGLAFGLNVMGDTRDDVCTSDGGFPNGGQCWTDTNYNVSFSNTAQYNATGDSITGVAKIPAKLPLIVTVVVAAVIIGILVRYLMVRYN